MTGLEEPEVDRDLLHHMRMITEILVSGSASSELLVGEVSQGRPGSESGLPELQAFTPNVKIVGRDLAHCARHVLKKPWQAYPTLSNLFETALWYKKRVGSDHRPQRCLPPVVQIILCPGLQQARHPTCLQLEFCQTPV